MHIPAKRFGPWGFSNPFWGIGATTTSTTSTTTAPATPPATQTQTQTQTQVQTSVITSVTDVTSVASATVVTTVVSTHTPASPATSPAASGTSTRPRSSSSAHAPSSSSESSASDAHARSSSSPPATGEPNSSQNPTSTSASSAADHASGAPAPGSGSSSLVYVTLSLSGSTVTQLSTARASVAANAASLGGARGMSSGEIAALVVACVAVFVLSTILCFVWRRRRRARMAQRDVHSPTHTISNGMVQIPRAHEDRHAVMDAVAYGSGSGSASSSGYSSPSVMSNPFRFTASMSSSDEGHPDSNSSTVGGRRTPSVSGGRTLIGASSENEKSSSAAASVDSHRTSPSPSPIPDGDAQMAEETPRSSTFLLHLQPAQPFQLSSSSSPAPPYPPGSIITPPPRTASASPRLLPVPPLSPLMPAGPPGLADTTRFSANPYAPYAYAWAVQSPTTVASEEGGGARSPYAWDHPPPSSEYLPGSSRRTTFRTSRGSAFGYGGGVPPYPSSPGVPVPMPLVEDGRSERSAPPMYTPSLE